MSAAVTAKLVRMANQVATAFDGQRGDAAGETAAHLKAFWSRPMREAILSHLAVGGEGLNPTVRAAVAALGRSDGSGA